MKRLAVFRGADACEPFEIHSTEFDRRGRPVVSSICKTEGRRYDFCIRTALIILKQHLDTENEVTSDEADEMWSAACEFCQRVLGYGGNFKLDH
jgi:hypothetical protein